MRDLLEHTATVPVALDSKQEKAAPTAGLLPLVPYLLLFARIVVRFAGLALEFDAVI